MAPSPRLARFAWAVLFGNVAVILWGAFVRASGSGAGCGNHWPMCNGEVIPRAPSVKTLIEMSHRATSVTALVFVMALGVLTFKDTNKGHPARRAVLAAVALIWGEVLIGAGLVLLKLVASDASLLRGVSMELHAGNTFLLLAALTLTAHYASGGAPVRLRGGDALLVPVVLSFSALALAFASGAIAALGDTLFPAQSLASGLSADLSPHAHLFLRLRTLHPLFAVTASALILFACGAVRARSLASAGLQSARRLSYALTAAVVGQVALGILNLVLLVPVATQLLHLLAADAVFILLVLMSANALARQDRGAPDAVAAPAAELSA